MKHLASSSRLAFAVLAVVAIHGVGFGFLTLLERPFFSWKNRVAVKVVVVTPPPASAAKTGSHQNDSPANSAKRVEAPSHIQTEKMPASQPFAAGKQAAESVSPLDSHSLNPAQPQTPSWPVLKIAYPPRAKRLGIEGRVIARVNSKNSELATNIVQSSGFEILDDAVRKSTKTSQFKADFFPHSIDDSILLTVDFKLKQMSPVKTQVQREVVP